MEEKQVNVTELGTIAPAEEKELQIGNATIKVRVKLPYERILAMVEWAISYIISDRPFISATLAQAIYEISLIKFYTNLNIRLFEEAETTISEVYELYDLLDQYEVASKISQLIDNKQLNFYHDTLYKTMESIIAYKNSAVGVIEQLTANADDITKAMQNAIDTIKDPEQLMQVKRLAELMEPGNSNK